MAQVTTATSKNILYHPLSLKQEFKEKKELLKSNPAEYANFLAKCRDCKFKFEQIEKGHIGTDKTYEVVQKQLSGIFNKMQRLVPQIPNPVDAQVKLLQMAEQFKAHHSQEGLAGFKAFETEFPDVSESVFLNLWQLKGSPQHVDRKELFFSALDTERAEAIESVYSHPITRLQEIGNLFRQNNTQEAFIKFEEFARVYPKLVDCIYGKIWELYGRPTKENHLSRIARDDFGYVAFHNLHPNSQFNFNCQHNAEAVHLISQELVERLANTQFMREQNIQRLDRRCVEVANETVGLFKKGEYVSRDGQKHDLRDYLKFSTTHTRLYREASPGPKQPRFAHTKFEVRAQNCVEMAYDLSFHGGNVLVLNLANSYAFGGCYLKARGTQEEELSRCLGLAPAVDTKHEEQLRQFYPLHKTAGPAGGLYTPQTPIIRMGMKNDYQFYDEPMPVAVATFAAYDKPNLDYSDPNHPKLQGEELKWTIEKIRTIYQCAYNNAHDTVILGALGCGAFANPPAHLVELFMDVYGKEFNGCFKYVGFAVMEDMNDGKKHNPEGNFKPFARMVQAMGGQAYDAKGQSITVS